MPYSTAKPEHKLLVIQENDLASYRHDTRDTISPCAILESDKKARVLSARVST